MGYCRRGGTWHVRVLYPDCGWGRPLLLTNVSSSGASVARRFAQKYAVALLARNPANYEPLVKEIEAAGGKAVGISTDVSDGKSVQNAFEQLKKEIGGAKVAAAVYNVGGGFVRKPFLELTDEEYEAGWKGNGYASTAGGHLSRSVVPWIWLTHFVPQTWWLSLCKGSAAPPPGHGRRIPGVSAYTHLHLSHGGPEGVGQLCFLRGGQVCPESAGAVLGQRVWPQGHSCRPRHHRRRH